MNIFEVGGKFEFDWMWYLQNQGFFVRRALPLTSDSAVEDATDIDVWGIKFYPPMVHSIVVLDCKYSKRPKAYERILWVKGLASYVGADQVYVGLPKTNWRAIDFGRRGGIRVVPYNIIQQHLQSLSEPEGAYGQARFDLHNNFFTQRKGALKAAPAISLRLFEARNLYLLGLPLTNINRAIAGLRVSMDELARASDDVSRQLWLFVSCEFITAFSLNLLKTAEETFTLSSEDRKGLVLKRLTYGDLPSQKAEEIIRLSQELAIAFARQSLPLEERSKIPNSFPGQGFQPPEYATEVHGLLERVIQHSTLYWEALKLLDAVLFEFVIQEQNAVGDKLFKAQSGVNEDVVKAAKNYIAVVCDAAGTSRKPFWIEISDQKGKEPSSPSVGKSGSLL